MKMLRHALFCFPVAMCLWLAPLHNAGAVDQPAYKGQLRTLVLSERGGDTLLLQYRSKTREVLRTGFRDLRLTDTRSGQVIRLGDRSASLGPGTESGYWHADIFYDKLDLTDHDYRLTGSQFYYLRGSQQWRTISVYLKRSNVRRPYESSIDWGIENPTR